MNRLLALIRKDLRLFFADRKAMFITFAVPIAIASFMGSLSPGSSSSDKPAKKIAMLVVDEDGSALSKKIVERLKQDTMAAPTSADLDSAREAVRSGKVAVALRIPKGFGENAPGAMFGGPMPKVELLYDPSQSMQMQALQGSVVQVAMQTVSQEAYAPGGNAARYDQALDRIEASGKYTAAEKSEYRDLFATLRKLGRPGGGSGTASGEGAPTAGGGRQPFELVAKPETAPAADGGEVKWSGMAHMFAGMAVQGVMFFAIDSAISILRDRRTGIWSRLKASPLTMGQILAGRALSSTLIGIFVLLGILLFGMLVFRIRVLGSPLGLGLVAAATALMVATFGLMVASLGRTESQARGLTILAVLSMSMLGGAWFPSFLLPDWVQKVGMFVPVKWAVDGFDAMLWRGDGLAGAMLPVAALAAFSLVFGSVALLRFRTAPEAA